MIRTRLYELDNEFSMKHFLLSSIYKIHRNLILKNSQKPTQLQNSQQPHDETYVSQWYYFFPRKNDSPNAIKKRMKMKKLGNLFTEFELNFFKSYQN